MGGHPEPGPGLAEDITKGQLRGVRGIYHRSVVSDRPLPVWISGVQSDHLCSPDFRRHGHLMDQDVHPLRLVNDIFIRSGITGKDHGKPIPLQLITYGAIPGMHRRKMGNFHTVAVIGRTAHGHVRTFMRHDVVSISPLRQAGGQKAEAFDMPIHHLFHFITEKLRSFFRLIPAGPPNIKRRLAVRGRPKTVNEDQIAGVIRVQMGKKDFVHP